MATLASSARTFLDDGAKRKRLGPELVHDVCNSFLERMRCGSRRHRPTHFSLRREMRVLREYAAKLIRMKNV